jgi:hypothetical protein
MKDDNDKNQLETIDDSDGSVQLDTDKLTIIMKSVEAIHTDMQNMRTEMASMRTDMTKGDSATRAYVDENVANIRKEVNENMSDIVALFKSEVRTVVDSVVSRLLAPIANDVSKFTEKSLHNEVETRDNSERINRLFSYNDQLAKQFTHEVQTRLIENSRILFALYGDGDTSTGLVGGVNELITLGKEQKKINETVQRHERVFKFITSNWRFAIASAGLLFPSLYAIFEKLDII